MGIKKYKDLDWLFDQYINQHKSSIKIAKICNVTPSVILRWLKRFNIVIRTTSQALRLFNGDKKYRNKDWLYEQYIIKEKTMLEIAKICDVSFSTIRSWLRKFNIKIRTKSEAFKILWKRSEYKEKMSISRKGNKNGNWKGNTKVHSKGYIRIYKPDHPFVGIRNYVMEHRLIMEEYLGRYLIPKEKVHHINGTKNDNRIENLYLCKSREEHVKIHHQMRNLIMKLYKKGIVKFNHEKGEYYYDNLC